MELIFTTHAKERMNLRKLHRVDIEETLSSPDKTIALEDKLNYKFIKTIDGREYQIVAHFDDLDKKWIIVSAWIRGEEDPPDLLWQIITAPFKALWWLIKNLCLLVVKGFKKLSKVSHKKHHDHH